VVHPDPHPRPEAPGALLAPGTTLAGYTVQHLIGTGPLGAVYAVTDPRLPRLDALKVITADLSADPGFQDRFTAQADRAASLDHPHIVSVYDRGRTDTGALWIATQYIPGLNAQDARRTGPMSPQRAVHIITAAADALDYAHERGITHGNLTPANIMLSGPVGPDEHVVLTDFGMTGPQPDPSTTLAGDLGWPAQTYAAPEATAGGPVDVYALTAVLHFLLTGQPPYPHASGAAALAAAHRQQPPPRPSHVGDAPAGYDTVIATGMAKNPADRYPSARALAEAAAAALADATAVAPHFRPTLPPARAAHLGYHQTPPTPPYPGPAPAAGGVIRRPGLLAAVIAALTVLTLAAWMIARPEKSVVGTATPQTTNVAAPTATAAAPSAATPAPTGAPKPPPPPASPVPAAELGALLLPVERIETIVAARMVAQPPGTGLANDYNGVDHSACAATLFPLQRNTYGDSGFTATAYQFLKAADPRYIAPALQAVAGFPDAERALNFVTRQGALWKPCTNTDITSFATAEQGERKWRIGDMRSSDDTIAITFNAVGRPHQCEHTMRAANNVVIEATVCFAVPPRGQTGDIAADIAAKATTR